MKTLPFALLLALLALPILAAPASDDEDEANITKTRFGKLSVSTDESDNLIHRLTLNGKEIIKFEGESLSVEKVLSSGNLDFALVAEYSGGSACPAMHVVVQLEAKKAPVISEEFGTCGEIMNPRIDKGTLVVEMLIYVSHPDLWDPKDLKDAERSKMVYTWSDGKITEKKVKK